MKGFSALVVLAMGSIVAAGTTLGWTSGVMADTLVAGVQAVGPLTFIVTPTQGNAAASTITITSSVKIFKADAATTCEITCATACAGAKLTCPTTGTGTILTCTTSDTALTESVWAIVCTDNLAVNPAAGPVTFAAISDLDTSSADAANVGYTTTAATTTTETNSTNASTNGSTNVSTTASLLINSAASVVSPGAVAFLLASLY